MRPIKWACGLTTVPQRRAELLPRTLASLAASGFPPPRVFMDGVRLGDGQGSESAERQICWPDYQPLGLECTFRWPALRTFGNWIMGLAELYIRDPAADRYGMFQDDLVACLNVRQYLDRCEYPKRGYWNLYTFSNTNEPIVQASGIGWHEGGLLRSEPSEPVPGGGGWQAGRGAVALVFSREAVVELLSSRHIAERPQDVQRGWRSVDGGIVTAMNKAGWREYVHNPSLVQHVGIVSTMRSRPHAQAKSFRGETFDALRLLDATG